MSANKLRNEIRRLRRPTATTGQYFVPWKLLYKSLTRELVSTTLLQSGISAISLDHLTDKVLNGGKKVLAILALLKGEESKIIDFFKHDQFTPTSLDSGLPFCMDVLNTVIPDIAEEFYEIQWEFTAPVFSKGVLHRELSDMTRLPFIQNNQIGSGGFGDIFEIKLANTHQTLHFTPPEDDLQAVRKEFKSDTTDVLDWEKELYNLNLLNELKHPNIVELLGSYTYLKKHNLIFRRASGGDLERFVETDRPADFASDASIFHALAQLASAVSTVHNFTSKKLNLSFIGCHHDLKPKNVLFDGQTFILADFGLSRFKDQDESSKEPFDVGQGHYLAPECDDPEDGFRKYIISRPSDIWSFGCILSEVLTFMLRGPGSVAEFKKSRNIKIGVSKTYTFHGGRFKPNPSVGKWLSELELGGERSHKMAVQLIRSMLSLYPENRPIAVEVSFSLAHIAINSYIDAIMNLFGELMPVAEAVEADMERRRFETWASLFEPTITFEKHHRNDTEDPVAKLELVLKCLTKCKAEISSILERYNTALSPLYSDVRALINQLHDFLPPELKMLAKSRVEQDLVTSEDLLVLEKMQNQFSGDSAMDRIGMLLTIKRMSILVFQQDKRQRPDLFIADSSNIHINDATAASHLGEHSLATIEEQTPKLSRRVVVEWIKYTTAWEGPVSEELMTRVEAIASLLNNAAKPIDQVLHCSGYYHEPNRHAFGVLYNFPNTSSSDTPVIPRTLTDVIQLTMDTRNRPSLEDRFQLAYRLAHSIIDCHKVGWMHKSISAHNVAFFHAQSSRPDSWLQNPYIIGFNHSRPDDPKAFTLGPGMARFKEYQHPSYHAGHRFVAVFDFYSLGLVLLEIGLWTTLQTMTTRWKYSNLEELRVGLLSRRVPLLNHAMGSGYRDAVEACLNSMLQQSSLQSQSDTRPTSLGFEVLKGLGKCPWHID